MQSVVVARKLRCGQLMAVLLIVPGALVACQRNTGDTAMPTARSVLSVAAVTVQPTTAPGFVELTGTVSAPSSVPLSTKLMSRITRLTLQEGQPVKRGDVLVSLDDTDIVAMRAEAAAFRAQARAALSEAAAAQGQAAAGVTQAESRLAQAQAMLADAQRDAARAQVLFDSDVIPRAQLEKAQLGVKTATENVAQARAGIEQAHAGVAQAQSRTPQVKAQEQQAFAKDAQAAALQDYAVLRAPFDGVVTHKYFQQGELSVPGQPILVVDQAGARRVRLALPADLAAQVKLGDGVDVVVDSPGGGSQSYAARLVVLSAVADPASRTVPAEAELPADSPAVLLDGQFVRVQVPAPAAPQTRLLIPAAAVVSEGELRYVWRISAAGTLAQAPVEVGATAGAQVAVVRGLSAGDRIVTNPAPELYAGAQVDVPAAAAAPQPAEGR
jgi:RND family efflux transporter MFP subunit